MNQQFQILYGIFALCLLFCKTSILAQEDARIPNDIPTNVITSIDWSPNGQMLALANNNGTIKIIDAVTGSIIQNLITAQPNPILTVAWSPDGSKVAATVGTEIHIWNIDTWQVLQILQGHLAPVWSVDWSPDGSKLASAVNLYSPNFNFFIWETTTWQKILTMEHFGSFYQVIWSPDNISLATTGGGAVELWKLPQTTEDKVLTFTNIGEIVDATWSPDGTKIATVGDNDSVLVWDVATQQVIQELTGHYLSISDLVFSVAWSPDGTRIASASTDDTVRVWDTVSGQSVIVFEEQVELYSLAWSPDGTKLAYGGENGVLHIVPVPAISDPKD